MKTIVVVTVPQGKFSIKYLGKYGKVLYWRGTLIGEPCEGLDWKGLRVWSKDNPIHICVTIYKTYETKKKAMRRGEIILLPDCKVFWEPAERSEKQRERPFNGTITITKQQGYYDIDINKKWPE
jgi:hypothetical protein